MMIHAFSPAQEWLWDAAGIGVGVLLSAYCWACVVLPAYHSVGTQRSSWGLIVVAHLCGLAVLAVALTGYVAIGLFFGLTIADAVSVMWFDRALGSYSALFLIISVVMGGWLVFKTKRDISVKSHDKVTHPRL